MTHQFRSPGPLGLSPVTIGGRPPGALQFVPGVLAAPNQVKAAVANGITVNPASEVPGEKWAKMLRDSPDLPEFIAKQVRWAGGRLTTPPKFRVPSNIIERDWLPDFVAAFELGGWELSTCHLEVTAGGTPSEQRITAVFVPHLSKDERLGSFTPVRDTWIDYKQVILTLGWTFTRHHAKSETGALLKSKRGLILVATRIVVKLDRNVQVLSVSEHEMVKTLVHEVAVHAGRANRGLPDTHGDETVEKRTAEINDEFKQPTGTKPVRSQAYELLEQFYRKEAKQKVEVKR